MNVKRPVTPIQEIEGLGEEIRRNNQEPESLSSVNEHIGQTGDEASGNVSGGQASPQEGGKAGELPLVDDAAANGGQVLPALKRMRREHDTRLGFRQTSISPSELSPVEDAEDNGAESEQEEIAEEVACDTSFFDKLQHILMPLLWLAAALLGCFITKNIADFYLTLRSMSTIEIVLFSIPMVLFSGILIFMLYKLARLMFQLRTFTQISGKALLELRKREELRNLCETREEEAKRQLEELLQDDETERDKLLASLGKEDVMMEIREARESLLDCHCTAREWFDKYLKEYQNKLDEVANSVISRYSWKAATAATASPFTAIDQIIVLATCVTMLKDLFLIYNLKPTWDKNLLLMSRIVIHVYVTGFWQDFSKAGVETLHKKLDSFLDNVKNTNTEGIMTKASEGMGRLIGGGLGQIVAKGVGECMMHKITVGRLGAAAIRLLRPVAK